MSVPKDAKASRVIRWQPRGTNIYLRSLDKEQGGERSLTQVKILLFLLSPKVSPRASHGSSSGDRSEANATFPVTLI